MSDFKKILIAVDGGSTSEKVAAAGYELGRKLQAEIGLLSVVETATLISSGEVSTHEMASLEKSELENNLDLLTKQVFGSTAVWHFVDTGDPVTQILTSAKEWGADLIVVGTHGRKHLSHLLLGSVAEKVIRHAAIPVTVIPVHHE